MSKSQRMIDKIRRILKGKADATFPILVGTEDITILEPELMHIMEEKDGMIALEMTLKSAWSNEEELLACFKKLEESTLFLVVIGKEKEKLENE